MSAVDLERVVSDEPDDEEFYEDEGHELHFATTLLDAAASDPDLRRVLKRSELWGELLRAEAERLGRGVEDVDAERAAQKPEGPRRYMTYDEWTRIRAGEIAHEGELGSHWPGKKQDHASER